MNTTEEPATLSAVEVCNRLGVAIPPSFITKSLGVPPRFRDREGRHMYRESDFHRIVHAFQKHLRDVSAKHPA